jgi:hypothetical protein
LITRAHDTVQGKERAGLSKIKVAKSQRMGRQMQGREGGRSAHRSAFWGKERGRHPPLTGAWNMQELALAYAMGHETLYLHVIDSLGGPIVI